MRGGARRVTQPSTPQSLNRLEKGQRGRSCTCGRSVPNGACCCYTTRCLPRRDSEGRRGLVFRWKRIAPSLDGRLAVRFVQTRNGEREARNERNIVLGVLPRCSAFRIPPSNKTGTPPWYCPKRAEFWRLCCAIWRAACRDWLRVERGFEFGSGDKLDAQHSTPGSLNFGNKRAGIRAG